MNDDWSLIVSSFQTQYGIRLSRDLKEMSWREFSYFINGLNGETPLGRIVSIRAENNPEKLKHFTKDEKRIRNEWRRKMALQKSSKEVAHTMDSVILALKKFANEDAEV